MTRGTGVAIVCSGRLRITRKEPPRIILTVSYVTSVLPERRAVIDVLTAREDGAGELDDSQLLSRATSLGRVLFTQDDDLLREAAGRQQRGETFAGMIYAHQLNVTVRQCIDDLELIAHASEPGE